MKEYRRSNSKSKQNTQKIALCGSGYFREVVAKVFSKLIILLGLMVTFQQVSAQVQNVKVTVVNAAGEPMNDVRIEPVSHPKMQVLTDSTGVANLDIAPEGFLKLYYRDMQKTFAFHSASFIVKLTGLDKKIHLGFGNVKPMDEITSSIDIIYSDDLSKSSSQLNPEESLYGQLAGLMVLQNGGDPITRDPDLLIRGKGTFSNSSILVLVDGFERDLSALSIAEIESIAVLKDGAALSAYGLRGANGVLLVTTKRGHYNSFEIDVSYDRGWNKPFRQPHFLDAYGYAQAVNQASILDGNPSVYSKEDLEDFKNGTHPFLLPNVNWMEETLRDFGTSSNLNTSFSGGGNTVKYFASLNYQNERGLFDKTNFDDRYDSQMKYDRFNYRANLDIELTKTTKFLVTVGGNIFRRNVPGAQPNNIFNALYSVPAAVFPVRTSDGNFGGTEFYANNPVALVSSSGVSQPNGRSINADGHIIQDLGEWVEGLSAEVALAYDNQNTYYENKLRDFIYENVDFTRNPSTGAISDTSVTIYGDNSDLNYSDSFGGQSRHATLYGKVNYENYWKQNEFHISAMYHQDKLVNDGQYNTFLRQNILGTASYGYKDRYFIDGALSYSGSSVLPKNNRFGLFPAISAAWIINRENFLKNSNVINYLKLRGSWGMSGSDLMNFNLYDQGFYPGNGYYFTDNNIGNGGIYEGQLPAKGLTYERSFKTSFGIDLQMFRQLWFHADVFYDKRKDVLTSTNGKIPSLVGVNPPIGNIGEVENKGVEAALKWNNNIGGFKYYVQGNFTFARNKILEMNEKFQPYDYLKRTGESIGQQFGLESLGFFKDQSDINNSPTQRFSILRPGDVKYKDQNNDGIIDSQDEVPIGHTGGYPEIYYGVNLGFEIYGFGMDALFQGIANQTLYLNTTSVYWPLRGKTNISTVSANSWTPETAATATLPRLSLLDNNNNYRPNDIWLRSGDYIKLRRLELYYRFPKHLIDSLKLKSAKIYGRGINLFSVDNIDALDPEEIGIGYPTLTSYHLGIRLEF